MKEEYIPTKDLKFSARVLSKVTGAVFEETKPILKSIAYDMADNLVRKTFRR